MELPDSLAAAARERTDRPARRLVNEWAAAEGAENQKMAILA